MILSVVNSTQSKCFAIVDKIPRVAGSKGLNLFGFHLTLLNRRPAHFEWAAYC